VSLPAVPIGASPPTANFDGEPAADWTSGIIAVVPNEPLAAEQLRAGAGGKIGINVARIAGIATAIKARVGGVPAVQPGEVTNTVF